MWPLASRVQVAHLLERGWPRTERLLGVELVDFLAVEDRDEARELALDLLARAGAAATSRSASAMAANSFFMWPKG